MSQSNRSGNRIHRLPRAFIGEWSLWEQKTQFNAVDPGEVYFYDEFAQAHRLQTERLDYLVSVEETRPGAVSQRGEWELRADSGFPT